MEIVGRDIQNGLSRVTQNKDLVVFTYAFTHFPLKSRILQKVKQNQADQNDQTRMTIIRPAWQTQAWFTELL